MQTVREVAWALCNNTSCDHSARFAYYFWESESQGENVGWVICRRRDPENIQIFCNEEIRSLANSRTNIGSVLKMTPLTVSSCDWVDRGGAKLLPNSPCLSATFQVNISRRSQGGLSSHEIWFVWWDNENHIGAIELNQSVNRLEFQVESLGQAVFGTANIV